jgi:hypothetical protein
MINLVKDMLNLISEGVYMSFKLYAKIASFLMIPHLVVLSFVIPQYMGFEMYKLCIKSMFYLVVSGYFVVNFAVWLAFRKNI